VAPQVRVNVLGEKIVQRNLNAMAAQAVNMRGPLSDAADLVLQSNELSFNVEGPGWAPLADSTVQRRGSAHPILEHSGRMKRSLTRRGGESRIRIQGDLLSIGSKVPYAAFHQTGTRRMPARPLQMTESTKRRIVELCEDRLADKGNGRIT